MRFYLQVRFFSFRMFLSDSAYHSSKQWSFVTDHFPSSHIFFSLFRCGELSNTSCLGLRIHFCFSLRAIEEHLKYYWLRIITVNFYLQTLPHV